MLYIVPADSKRLAGQNNFSRKNLHPERLVTDSNIAFASLTANVWSNSRSVLIKCQQINSVIFSANT